MKKPIILVTVAAVLLSAEVSFADSYKVYDASSAVAYAKYNYDRPYGASSSQNQFYDYTHLVDGANCTNFVSQAIMAGFVKSKYSSTVYPLRYDYDIDRSGSGSYKWFFRSDSDRGPAFTGAQKLYEYATHNLPSYKGLHFGYVTHDTLTTYLDPKKVKKGDVIFADWDHDGYIDHAMLVTDIDRIFYSWYNEIRLTYQGRPGVVGVTDIGLGDLNDLYLEQALFYVYRPIDYNPSGL